MLRIAFDLDGTLADLRSALDRIAEELFPQALGESPAKAGLHEGSATTPANAGVHEERDSDAGALAPEEEQLEPPELKLLSRRQQQQIWDTVRGTTNFWETLGETEPGIVARIAAVAEERRWEVLFITQRPSADGDTTQRQSQRWLAAHGFPMPSVYVLSPNASRGQVATALSLDVVVDDRSEQCLDVKLESKARAFLVARDAASPVAPNARRLGIEVVTTVGECLDILSAAPREKEGLLGQIKRIFTRNGQA
jgi:phosphoglycolate phosphatase-like HAD superfamily hydrolase